jgi:hypothetical protein
MEARMAISNYAELIESLSVWLDDSDLGGRERDLIALCEDELNARLAAALREGAMIRPMVERGPLTIDAEYIDLPNAAMVLPIGIEVTDATKSWEVLFTSPERLMVRKCGAEEGLPNAPGSSGPPAPRWYTLTGGQLRFHPVPDESMSAVFTRFSKVPALSDDVPSNWVLANHRNAYLYGSLAQAEFFGWNDARMANVATLFAQAVDGIVVSYPTPTDRAALTTEIAAFGLGAGPIGASAFLVGGF